MINTNEGEPVPCDDNKLLESADKVIEDLKQHIQQKQAEIEKDKKQLSKLQKKEDRLNAIGNLYYNMNSLIAVVYGGISAIIATVSGVLKQNSIISKLGGTSGSFDEIKAYLLNHPEELQKAQEKLGSTDINFVSGYLTGDDSLANALFAQTGLREFFVNNADIAANEAQKFGGEVFVGLLALGLGGYLVGKIAYDNRDKYDSKIWHYNGKIYEQEITLERAQELLNELSNEKESFESGLRNGWGYHSDYHRGEVKNLVEKATRRLKSDKELKR